MTTNIRSTVGGAFSALGTSLMGVGVIPQLAGNPSKTLTIIATVGFVCTAIGQFLGHLFAADAKALQVVNQQVQATTDAMLSGDTTFLRQTQAVTKAIVPDPTPTKP